MAQEPVKIVIHLEGGLIQYVYGNIPMDVIILDTDIDEEEAENRRTIKDPDGEDLEIYSYANPILDYRDPEDKAVAEHYFNEIKTFT